MNKLDELMALLQKQEKEEEKCKNTVMWVRIAFFALCAKNHPQFIVWCHLSHEVIRHGHGFFNRQELPLERFSNDV